MPIYQYHCKKCNIVFEKLFDKVTDKKEICPKCKSKSHKIPSRMTFTLKGSGWAADGYSKPK